MCRYMVYARAKKPLRTMLNRGVKTGSLRQPFGFWVRSLWNLYTRFALWPPGLWKGSADRWIWHMKLIIPFCNFVPTIQPWWTRCLRILGYDIHYIHIYRYVSTVHVWPQKFLLQNSKAMTAWLRTSLTSPMCPLLIMAYKAAIVVCWNAIGRGCINQ